MVFRWSPCLSLCRCHTVSITVATVCLLCLFHSPHVVALQPVSRCSWREDDGPGRSTAMGPRFQCLTGNMQVCFSCLHLSPGSDFSLWMSNRCLSSVSLRLDSWSPTYPSSCSLPHPNSKAAVSPLLRPASLESKMASLLCSCPASKPLANPDSVLHIVSKIGQLLTISVLSSCLT